MGNGVTLDTHSLLWYVDRSQNRKLSKLALESIITAEGSGMIYIPAMVIMETFYLIEKGRFSLRAGKDQQEQAISFLSMIVANPRYHIVPIDANLLKATIPLRGLKIHDRLILATAVLTDSVLVSKDREITAMGVNIVW